MRLHWQSVLLFLIVGSIAPLLAHAENGFAYCPNVPTYLSLTSVTSNLYGSNSINVTLLGSTTQEVPGENLERGTLATAFIKASMANVEYYSHTQNFCELVKGNCPVRPGNVTISLLVPLPSPNVPLGSVTTSFHVKDPLTFSFTCITTDLSFQRVSWQFGFTWTTIAITLFSSIVSIMPGLVHRPLSGDIFIYSSNYALESKILGAKTPGLIDLVFYAQFILASGQLSLGYPGFYPWFVADFSWAGLFLGMDWLTNIVQSTSGVSSPSSTGTGASTALSHDAQKPSDKQLADTVASLAHKGLGRFSTVAGVDPQGIFLTVFIWFLIVMGAVVVVHIVIFFITELLAFQWPYRYGGARPKVINFTLGNFLRILWIFYLPLVSVSFYQLMTPSVWYLNMLAALMIIFPLLGLMAYVSYLILRVRPPSVLFDDFGILLRLGPLYNMFTDDTFQFFLVALVYRFVYGAILGLAHDSGTAQVVILCVVEGAYLVGLSLMRPYADLGVNRFHQFFALLRTLIMCLSLAYIDAFRVGEGSKQYVGYVQIVLHWVAYLVFFVASSKTLLALVLGYDGDMLESLGARMWKARMWQSRQAEGRVNAAVPAVDLAAAGDEVGASVSPTLPSLPPMPFEEPYDSAGYAGGYETPSTGYHQRSWSGAYDEYGMSGIPSAPLPASPVHRASSPVSSASSPRHRPLSLGSSLSPHLNPTHLGDEPESSFYRHSRRSIRRKQRRATHSPRSLSPALGPIPATQSLYDPVHFYPLAEERRTPPPDPAFGENWVGRGQCPSCGTSGFCACYSSATGPESSAGYDSSAPGEELYDSPSAQHAPYPLATLPAEDANRYAGGRREFYD
ncbi:uncharacterized protein VTP21DRAFT_7980 [Calcarisporiella thermophila]|uniref:uncharacterized protein n=1 Tax=Calcarisporiella thermophila TaxID=911321 RepID=UPI003744993B